MPPWPNGLPQSYKGQRATEIVAGRKFEEAMKTFYEKVISMIAIALFCLGCDGEVKVNEEKLNTAGAKLQKTVEKGVDSIGAKPDRLEDKLDKDDTLKD